MRRSHAATAVASLVTEKQFLAQVRDLSAMLGWRLYHPWLSKYSESGWPDVALVRPPRVVLAELKTESGKVSPSQREWLDLLARCPGVETYLWRPTDIDTIAEVLR